MKVNFDNLRKGLGSSFNELITYVDDNLEENKTEELKKHLYKVRAYIGSILSCYGENETFNDIDFDLRVFKEDE